MMVLRNHRRSLSVSSRVRRAGGAEDHHLAWLVVCVFHVPDCSLQTRARPENHHLVVVMGNNHLRIHLVKVAQVVRNNHLRIHLVRVYVMRRKHASLKYGSYGPCMIMINVSKQGNTGKIPTLLNSRSNGRRIKLIL